MILTPAELTVVDDALSAGDPMGQHVVSVMGSPSEWKVGCPWALAAAALVDTSSAVGWPLPVCAVVDSCPECGSTSFAGESGVRAQLHQQEHALINGRRLLLASTRCGLGLDIGEARRAGGWLHRIREGAGEGVYTVTPAVTATGSLIGVDPVALVVPA